MIDVPIQVKDALRDGRLRKNYRFNVLNSDGTTDFTIDNDTLVSESVSIDERMCSGDTIKFGLCEGSSLEFQYFNHPNITDRQIQAFIGVFYEGIPTEYEYVSLFRQNERLIITEKGYYKVFSAYANGYDRLILYRDGDTETLTPTVEGDTTYIILECEVGDELEVEWDGTQNFTALLKATGTICYIPMGYFTVKNCSRQASTGIIKATCYNKLQSAYLDQKANSLLLADLGGDGTLQVTLYDVQRLLLSNYEIIERPRNPIAAVSTNSTGKLGLSGYYYFSSAYIDTPLSAAEWNYIQTQGGVPPAGTRVYPAYSRHNSHIQTPVDKYWQVDFLKGDIDVFVDNLLEYAVDVLESAQFWQYSDGYIYTRSEIESILRNSMKFIVQIDNDQYNLFDSSKRPSEMLKEINKLIYYGQHNVWFHIPLGLGFHNVDTDQYRITAEFDQEYTYKYWINDSGVTRAVEKTVTPYVLYSDGTPLRRNDTIFQITEIELSEAEQTTVTVNDLPEFTLRDIVTANYETQCQFGQLDRVTDLFSGVELNHSRLLPQETLYPDTALYPDGAAASATKSMYSKLWADEGNIHKWRYLIITYKGLDANNSETDFTLQRTINADGTDDYNCSDNWLFRNLIWTEQDIGAYADAMVAKMQDITWFPFEMWCAGLPYLETGDEIEIPLGEDSYTSYVLQRQLKGIQNLQDTYINGTLDIF